MGVSSPDKCLGRGRASVFPFSTAQASGMRPPPNLLSMPICATAPCAPPPILCTPSARRGGIARRHRRMRYARIHVGARLDELINDARVAVAEHRRMKRRKPIEVVVEKRLHAARPPLAHAACSRRTVDTARAGKRVPMRCRCGSTHRDGAQRISTAEPMRPCEAAGVWLGRRRHGGPHNIFELHG